MWISRTLLCGLLCGLLAGFVSAPPARGQEPERFPVGRLVERVAAVRDPTQTYALYLPSAYTPEKKFPALLIFDPRGRAMLAAELFVAAAEAHGWILLSSWDTRSDGPMEPNRKALDALWPEVHERFPTDWRRIYAAGFSGGAMLAFSFGLGTGELAGVIGCGGRPEEHNRKARGTFAHFGVAGRTDFNYSPMRLLDSQVEGWGVPHWFEAFDGPHAWMPAALAGKAIAWMEIQAMHAGLRAPDAGIVADFFAQEIAAARSLEESGRPLEALRRYRLAAATVGALGDPQAVAAARDAAERLAASSAVELAQKEERKWDGAEAAYLGRIGWLGPALAQRDPPIRSSEIVTRLEIHGLRKRAAAGGYAGIAAERTLESLFSLLAFYETRDLFAAGEWQAAATALEVALAIKPERGDAWYNLACAQARARNPRRALEALERAVDNGFSSAEQMRGDPDLESLRDTPEFQRILAGLAG